MKQLFTLSAVFAAALLSNAAIATPVSSMSERALTQGSYGTILAREAEPGDKRHGKDDGAGHKAIEQTPMGVARREAEQRGNDDGAGHKAIEQAPMSVAKEGEQRGNDDGAGHKAIEEQRGELVARAETSHGGKRRPAGKRGA